MTENNINWAPAVAAWDKLQSDQNTTVALIQDDWRAIGMALLPIREKYVEDKIFGERRRDVLPELSANNCSHAMTVAKWPEKEWRKVKAESAAATPQGLVKTHAVLYSIKPPPTSAKPKTERKGWNVQLAARVPAPKGVDNLPKWISDHRKELFAHLGDTIPRTITDADADEYAEACMVWLASRGETNVVEEAKKGLSLTAKEKLERAISRGVALENKQLRDEYQAAFVKDLAAAVKEATAELDARAKRISDAERRLRDKEAGLQKWMQRETGKANSDFVVLAMSAKDFRMLVRAIHPDRFPEEFRDKLSKAAAVINAGLH